MQLHISMNNTRITTDNEDKLPYAVQVSSPYIWNWNVFVINTIWSDRAVNYSLPVGRKLARVRRKYVHVLLRCFREGPLRWAGHKILRRTSGLHWRPRLAVLAGRYSTRPYAIIKLIKRCYLTFHRPLVIQPGSLSSATLTYACPGTSRLIDAINLDVPGLPHSRSHRLL